MLSVEKKQGFSVTQVYFLIEVAEKLFPNNEEAQDLIFSGDCDFVTYEELREVHNDNAAIINAIQCRYIAAKLEEWNRQLNQGRGLAVLVHICNHLRRGERKDAEAICYNSSDKLWFEGQPKFKFIRKFIHENLAAIGYFDEFGKIVR